MKTVRFIVFKLKWCVAAVTNALVGDAAPVEAYTYPGLTRIGTPPSSANLPADKHLTVTAELLTVLASSHPCCLDCVVDLQFVSLHVEAKFVSIIYYCKLCKQFYQLTNSTHKPYHEGNTRGRGYKPINLQTSAAILLSGVSYTKYQDLFALVGEKVQSLGFFVLLTLDSHLQSLCTVYTLMS